MGIWGVIRKEIEGGRRYSRLKHPEMEKIGQEFQISKYAKEPPLIRSKQWVTLRISYTGIRAGLERKSGGRTTHGR